MGGIWCIVGDYWFSHTIQAARGDVIQCFYVAIVFYMILWQPFLMSLGRILHFVSSFTPKLIHLEVKHELILFLFVSRWKVVTASENNFEPENMWATRKNTCFGTTWLRFHVELRECTTAKLSPHMQLWVAQPRWHNFVFVLRCATRLVELRLCDCSLRMLQQLVLRILKIGLYSDINNSVVLCQLVAQLLFRN